MFLPELLFLRLFVPCRCADTHLRRRSSLPRSPDSVSSLSPSPSISQPFCLPSSRCFSRSHSCALSRSSSLPLCLRNGLTASCVSLGPSFSAPSGCECQRPFNCKTVKSFMRDEAQLTADTSASEECRNPLLCAASVREEAAAGSGAKAQRQNCSNPVLGRFSPQPPSPDAKKGFIGSIKDLVSAPGWR